MIAVGGMMHGATKFVQCFENETTDNLKQGASYLAITIACDQIFRRLL